MPQKKDPLQERWAKKITREVRTLKHREKGANRRINTIRADIGDRCLKMKNTLKHGDFSRWYKANVHRDQQRVNEYMSAARFRSENHRTFGAFADFDPCKMTRIAAVPPEKLATLTPDTVLPVPGTKLSLALGEMGYRKLDAALDAWQGNSANYHSEEKRLEACVALLEDARIQDAAAFARVLDRIRALADCAEHDPLPKTRDERAQQVVDRLRALTPLIKAVGGGVGRLSGLIKGAFEDEMQDRREDGLHWPAKSIRRPRRGLRIDAPIRSGNA